MAKSNVSVPTYLKRAAKSMGYMVGETFESYNPVLKDMIKETKDVVDDTSQFIRKFTGSNGNDPIIKSMIELGRNTYNDAIKNIKSDLKTGNWYNKQRKEASELELAKAFGLDLGGFDDWDNWDEDWDDVDESTSMQVSAEVESSRNMILAMDSVGASIANSVSAATIESASYLARSNSVNTQALVSLNQRGFSQVTQALMHVNNTVTSFAKIGEPLTAHMQNSSVFYTKTTETLNKMEEHLKTLVEYSKPPKLSSERSSRSSSGSGSSKSSGDITSLSGFKSFMEEKVKEIRDLTDGAGGFLDSFIGDSKSLGKNISPISMVGKYFIDSMIPKMFKESMKSFNDSLKYMTTAGIVKARSASTGNIFLDIFKDMLLPDDGYKSGINVSNYEKGRVAWDGISRKAITEVIPEFLSKIYFAISGKDEHYDYNTGKFVTRKSIEKSVADRRSKYAQRAGGDFRTDTLDRIANDQSLTPAARKQLRSEIEKYFETAFLTGEGFYDVYKDTFNKSAFGLTDESLKILQDQLKFYRNSKDSKYRNRANKFVVDVNETRTQFGKDIRAAELSGTDLEIYMKNNGSGAFGSGTLMVDEYNNSPLHYLQGIYNYTGYLADNIDYISGRSGKARSRKKLRKGAPVDDIAKAMSEKGPSERVTSEASIIPGEGQERNKEKEKKDRFKEASRVLESKYKTTTEKMKGFAKALTPANVRSIYNKPFEATADILDAIGFSIDKLIWGDSGEEGEDGIFGYIFKHTKSAFDKFNTFVDERFGVNIKGKITNFWDYLWGAKDEEGKRQGGRLKDLREDTVANLKGAGRWVGRTARQALFGDDVERAAYGKKVTKTGIVAVSEGELIIPSELNPFYKGRTNKRKQVKDEQRAVNNFYGSYAYGGTAEDQEARRQRREQNMRNMKEHKGFLGFLYMGLENLFGGATEFVSNAVNGNTRESRDQSKKDRGIIGNLAKKFLEEAGDNKGAIGAGALIGTGVSLLTGAVVGPLFGAAIGGAVGLTVKSKTVQKLLFGETDEEGNLEGGLLNKEVSNFLMKSVPSMAKGATLGAGTGLFLGSPILGAVVGATAGYVKSSINAKTYLFGKQDGDDWQEGLISKDLQDKIKKAAPNISAGMLLGITAGPFGIIGNLALGAGLGYLSTSEDFHKFIFGDGEGDRGLAGTFKEKVIDNLDDIFHNMGNAISGWGKSLIAETKDNLKTFFRRRAHAYLNGESNGPLARLTRFGARAGRVALKPVRGLGRFAGNALDRTASGLRGMNLRRGYGVYDRTLRRNMYASERMDARGGVADGTFGTFDSILAQASSKEELQELRRQLDDARNPNRAYKRNRSQVMGGIYAKLDGLDPKKATAIVKLMEKGDTNSVSQIYNMLTPEERTRYMSAINEGLEKFNSIKNTRGMSRDTIDKFRRQGIDISKAGNLNAAIDQINYELTNSRFSDETVARDQEKTWRDRVLKVFESMDINISRLVGGRTADGDRPNPEDFVPTDNDSRTSIRDFLNNTRAEQNADTRTEIDAFGNVHQYTRNDRGEWEEVNNDSETDESRRRMNNFMDSINQLPIIGSTITMMGSLFNKIHDKLFGSEEGEEKEGFFDKIMKIFNGEGGIFGGLASWFTGTKVGGVLAKVFAGKTLGGVVKGLVGPALIAAGLGGKFDDAAHKLTDGAYGKADNMMTTAVDAYTGKEIIQMTDDSGNTYWVDAESGQKVDNPLVTDVQTRKVDNSNLSQKMAGSVARGVATGKGSLISKAMTKFTPNIAAKLNTATDFLKQNVGKVMSGGDDIATRGARLNLGTTIRDTMTKIANVLKKIPGLKGMGSNLDNMATELANKAIEKLSTQSAAKIASLAGRAVPWIKIGFAIYDFEEGYNDARNTFGIVEEPSVGQKLASGILRAVKNLSLIGVLLPDKMVLDLIVKYLAPALGISTEELMKQRENAQATVDAYNVANGTTYTVEQYNKEVQKKYTFGETVGNGVRTFGSKIMNFFTGGGRSGLPTGRGAGIGTFISQLDPKFKDKKFGRSTVGQLGCAPAVATMAANAFGKNLNMNQAISSAGAYQNSDGTTIDYFKDILGRKGLQTEYMEGNNIPEQVINSLKNGQKVILLGKDRFNKSKKDSPFGPNGHYVMATGFDKNGNIIIYDPENKGPKAYPVDILKAAEYGINTGNRAGGAAYGTYDSDNAKKIWAFFTSKGYSPAATAGILGNLWQESKFNPAAIQGNGQGPAAGIAQWENYNTKSSRWRYMYDHATSRGYKWTELTPQLEYMQKELTDGSIDRYFQRNTNIKNINEYKAMKDPQQAAIAFEKAYERAGKPNYEARVKAAEAMYRLYADSSYTGKWTPDSPDPNAVDTMSSGLSTSDEGSSLGALGILGSISQAFTNAFAKVFGGGDESTMGTTGSLFGDSASVINANPAAMNWSNKSPVDWMRSILGKIKYSMEGPRNPEKGSADCSSTVNWAIQKAGGPNIGGNTASQYENPALKTVWYNNGNYANELPPNIKKDDILFFSRPQYDYTAGRKDRVGHIEMYAGDGQMIGHGGGMGPKLQKVPLGQKGQLVKVSRVAALESASHRPTPRQQAAGSSGLLNQYAPSRFLYEREDLPAAGASGLVVRNRFTPAGAASQIANETVQMLNTIKNNAVSQASSGTISADLVQSLIKAIVDVLERIANNTAPVGQIYQALAESNLAQQQKSEAPKPVRRNRPQIEEMSEIDSNIKHLVGTLSAIAKG